MSALRNRLSLAVSSALLSPGDEPIGARTNPETLLLVNPRGRKRRSGRRQRGFLSAGGGSASIRPSLSTLKNLAIPAFHGAAGALAVNGAMRLAGSYGVLPAMLVEGRMIYLTRAAAAIAVGMLAQNFVGGRIAVRMAEGALTVVVADVLRDVLMQTAGINLSGVGYYSPARVVGPSSNRPALAGAGRAGKYLTAVGGTGKYLSGGNASMRQREGAVR